MKKLSILILLLFIGSSISINAQTADEIIENYFENTGGKEQWEELEGLKITAAVNNQGMEIPLEIIQLEDGKQATIVNFQGMEIKQNVFDGETLWATNFQSQKAEKSDAEQTANIKLEANDFPNPFMNYKEKGYTIELMGKEDFGGTEVYKLKLVQEPITVDGMKEENISFYYFDAENYVPLAVHKEMKSGPMKGQISEVTFSDYQEVDGLYFPFSMTQGIKDGQSGAITIKSIELNPDIDDAIFDFPEE